MNQTWPYLNPITEPKFPVPFTQSTSSEVHSTSDHVLSVVRNTYQPEAGDCEVQIWYAGSMPGITPLSHIPRQRFRIVQTESCLPFYECDTDLVLSSDPEDDSEIEPALYGYHTHSLIFTHPLSLELIRELRSIEVLSYDDPVVFYITLTYKCGATPIFRSRFLANYVRSDNLNHDVGVLTKETVFQCFLAEMLLPYSEPTVPADPVEEFNDLMLQAAIYQQALEDDLSEDFDFDDDDQDDDE